MMLTRDKKFEAVTGTGVKLVQG